MWYYYSKSKAYYCVSGCRQWNLSSLVISLLVCVSVYYFLFLSVVNCPSFIRSFLCSQSTRKEASLDILGCPFFSTEIHRARADRGPWFCVHPDVRVCKKCCRSVLPWARELPRGRPWLRREAPCSKSCRRTSTNCERPFHHSCTWWEYRRLWSLGNCQGSTRPVA